MLRLRNCIVVVGCVCVGFAASAGPGLVASAAEPEHWAESSLVASPADDDDAAGDDGTRASREGEAPRRIAQLEQRLKDLEAERVAAASGGPAPRGPSAELDSVLARNQELVARNRALAAENQALAESHLFEPSVAAACEAPPGGADARAQLRYWADRLRNGDSGVRSRLTPEQNAAVNVLLRRERELDPRNPWREL